MSSKHANNEKTPRQLEIERLSQLPTAPFDPRRPTGVLLSDEIKYYCDKYSLLSPYDKANIKPANYELRVGYKYSIGGAICELEKFGDLMRIPPFEVAIVEIYETVNMPAFLIGRWNIRTRWAYRGLIWVGGPQVDAGYRGKLFCPIWNLSDQQISIICGDPIAILDFVTTTPPTDNSIRYNWMGRSRFLLEDYGPDNLKRALITTVKRDIDIIRGRAEEAWTSAAKTEHKTTEALERSNARIDNTTSVMFAAFGVLVAAVAIFATKPPDHYWWDPTVFLLCWTTASLSLFVWVTQHVRDRWSMPARILIAALALGAVVADAAYEHHQARKAENTIQELTDKLTGLERRLPAAVGTHPAQ